MRSVTNADVGRSGRTGRVLLLDGGARFGRLFRAAIRDSIYRDGFGSCRPFDRMTPKVVVTHQQAKDKNKLIKVSSRQNGGRRNEMTAIKC
uniref:Uncharacterized protein n=1 Tax=Plectus sambesii TaxID=2011161 RepID=A0A914VPA5_9BILA